MSEPEVGTPSSDSPATAAEKPTHRGRWTAIIGAIAVAVLGATAAAVITPDRIDSMFGWSEPAATPSTERTEPVLGPFQTVASTDGALILDVPEDWSWQQSHWNVTDHAGTGVLVGTQLVRSVDFRSEGAWLGASADVVGTAGVATMTAAERERWVDSFVDLDWTIDGCVPVSGEPKIKTGWLISTREWKECASTEGQRMLEFAALTEDLEILVVGQVSLTKATPDGVFDAILDSFVVMPEKLPGAARSGDLVVP